MKRPPHADDADFNFNIIIVLLLLCRLQTKSPIYCVWKMNTLHSCFLSVPQQKKKIKKQQEKKEDVYKHAYLLLLTDASVHKDDACKGNDKIKIFVLSDGSSCCSSCILYCNKGDIVGGILGRYINNSNSMNYSSVSLVGPAEYIK
uniref:Uncharacterized protein n=1 Tax=Glossina pallidipes TaxID=7398 RepID=A0A1B0A921_GLOPL